MAKQVKVVAIDGVEYEITQLGGVEGLELYDRLCRELGPAVSNAVRTGLLEANAETKIAFMLVESMATLPSAFKKELWTRFAGLSKIKAADIMLPLGDGKRLEEGGTFDQHFAGKFGHMTRWLMACLKWSFGDFLPSSPASADPVTPTATTP